MYVSMMRYIEGFSDRHSETHRILIPFDIFSQDGSDTTFHHLFVLSGLCFWGSATWTQQRMTDANNHAISNFFFFFSHLSTVCINVSPTYMPKPAESLCGKGAMFLHTVAKALPVSWYEIRLMLMSHLIDPTISFSLFSDT